MENCHRKPRVSASTTSATQLTSTMSYADIGRKRESRAADAWRSRSTLYGTQDDAFVCSSQPAAVNAGLEILRQGGNAADAALAVVSTLNVVEPVMCGIGGSNPPPLPPPGPGLPGLARGV